MQSLTFEGFGSVALTAEAWGDADSPAVLLLPAGGQTRRSWRAAAQALADAGRYAICIDLRGHGGSAIPSDGRYDLDAYVADLRQVLRQMSNRPVVVGTSIGGLAAIAALGETPQPIASGLVLVGVAPWQDVAVAKAVAAELEEHSRGFADPKEAAEALSRLHRHQQVPASTATVEEDLTLAEDGRFYWQWDPRFLRGLNLRSAAERLEAAAPGIKVPTLIVHGEQSRAIGLDAVERLRGSIDGAELVSIAGVSHLAATDDTEAFNATLLEFLERRLPRTPIAYEAGSDARTLRDGLGCFGTGVTVITAMDGDKPIGLTANSFTSVSLDPPLILFCVDNKAGSLPILECATHFAVNVLHIGQQPTSGRFATRGIEDRFSGVAWERWDDGAPILTGSLASFDCERHSMSDGGDHRIFVGQVRRARFEPRRDPLIYFRGKYRRLHFD
jgi:flavin reductase (DIM6/NTAB) family NADH-FMN oxidoreductase RutF/pimeloyl-ACP methyl ester carboxylesterase